MRADRESVRSLFATAGRQWPRAWTDAALRRGRAPADAAPDPAWFDDPAAADLAEAIIRALARGEPVVLTAPGEEPPMGVVDTIVALLSRASADRPLSRDDLVYELSQRFPGRDGIRATVRTYVPSRLRAKRFLTVRRNSRGFWIEPPHGG